MGQLSSWELQSVSIPADAGVERTFDGWDLTPSELARCDHRTVFCDLFLSPDDRELLCIGPPFANLGRPRAVLADGSRKLPFAVEEPVAGELVALTRVRLTEAPASPLHLRFAFAEFEIAVDVTPRRPEPPPVSLLLSTIQKDNDPRWVEDWCAWHHLAHGVERIVIYDNGSANADETRTRLAQAARRWALDLIVVDWDFPFGPPIRYAAHHAPTVTLNHCRLAFGARVKWCINLDVDEYLYNESGLPLADHLQRRGRRSVHYLTGLIVPMVTDGHPARCFDSAVRFRAIEPQRGIKYVYRPGRVGWLSLHRVRPRLNRVTTVLYALGVMAWRRMGLRRKLRRLTGLTDALAALATRAARIRSRSEPVRAEVGNPGPLFFYHFRALNTGWRFRRKVVQVEPEDVVADPRITRMKEVIEAGHRGRGNPRPVPARGAGAER